MREQLAQAIEARDQARTEKLKIQELIREAQIEENNLRHRFNVFQSLKKAERQGKKVKGRESHKENQNDFQKFENSEKLFEIEKERNDKILAETEAMEAFLKEAQKQESNLEKAIERCVIPGESTSAF